MSSCLGIHFSDKIVKFAKISVSDDKKSPKVTIDKYGVKFLVGNRVDLINDIIYETKSEDIPVVLGAYEDFYTKVQVFKQLSKNDAHSVINLEFEDWCTRNSKDSPKYLYTYFMPDVSIGDYYSTMISIASKEEIELYKNTKNLSIMGMYTTPFAMTTLVPKDEKNYILVNLDDKLYMTTVIDGKIVEFDVDNLGMKDMLDKFVQLVGSEQKAYEACKAINVFADSDSSNQKDLEAIVEPLLQDILKKVADVVNKRKPSVNKVLITGIGTLFTNIDILFREYLEIKAEILKPDFMTSAENLKNVAEELEALPAISIAKEYLIPSIPNVSYYKKSTGIVYEFMKKFFGKKETQIAKNVNSSKPVFQTISKGFDFSKIIPITTSASIIIGLALLSYIIFSNIYYSQISNMKKDIDSKTSQVNTLTSKVSSDISYINNNANQYKSINDDVQSTVDQIENNQIGKINTYNVATFMQKIIKVIPQNVQLKTITSDDNKKVKITAQSDSYADLGYFVAQLKLQGVLNNVKINSVTNSSTIGVEIGGDLP